MSSMRLTMAQALHEGPDMLTYYQARNEHVTVHAASGFARM
jgi:TPP-dependent trihydroxycyclohexane-1,2-dione (THcHDO) dehydratase